MINITARITYLAMRAMQASRGRRKDASVDASIDATKKAIPRVHRTALDSHQHPDLAGIRTSWDSTHAQNDAPVRPGRTERPGSKSDQG